MKKVTYTVLLFAMVFILSSPLPGYARGGGHFAGGHIGGFGGYRGSGHIVVRGGFGWGWWPWVVGGAMVAPYYYSRPPVVVQEQPPVYVQPEQQQDYYWYYCPDPQGYYPYIKSCPSGWMKVVPDVNPPNPEEGMAK